MWVWSEFRNYVGFDREFFVFQADIARRAGRSELADLSDKCVEYIDGNHAGATFIAHESQIRDRMRPDRVWKFEDFKREQHYITDATHGVGWRRGSCHKM